MEFQKDLVKLFNNDATFRGFLRSLMVNKVDLRCRHSDDSPSNLEVCGYYRGLGTNDSQKGMVVRKSTVWAAACKYLLHLLHQQGTFSKENLEKYPPNLSTKVDVSQLLVFLRYKTPCLRLIEEIQENGWGGITCLWLRKIRWFFLLRSVSFIFGDPWSK